MKQTRKGKTVTTESNREGGGDMDNPQMKGRGGERRVTCIHTRSCSPLKTTGGEEEEKGDVETSSTANMPQQILCVMEKPFA